MLIEDFIPVDKSSAIRAFLFSLLTTEKVEIFCGENDLPRDALSAFKCLKLFDKTVENKNGKITVLGIAKTPEKPVDCGNSATMMHILMGIREYFGWNFGLTGDESLMSRDHGDFEEAAKLYDGGFVETGLAKESAQLKSFHLLAMLKSGGKLHFKAKTRRNTEELLLKMGVKLVESEALIEVLPAKNLHGYNVTLQKDPSSAFIAACAALICKKSFEISNIYPEKLRMEPFRFLAESGYDIEIKYEENSCTVSGTPKVCEKAEHIEIDAEKVSAVIDEIPFIAFMTARNGLDFCVKEAKWLRNKESDRITESVKRLSLLFETAEFADGFTVYGVTKHVSKGCFPHSSDHRMEMLSFLMAKDSGAGFKMNDSYKISFPKFYELTEYLKND
jgi:3-phosphoshikimate 1-carboxyvinyltransferase